MPSEYRIWWDFIRAGNNQHAAYNKWFSDHRDELPSTITSMISIGAGCGDLDVELIQSSLTGLRSYTGVEPDPDNRETLAATLAMQCPDVQVFYYFPDHVAALQQLYNWLRPGGMLIIGHSHSDSMYANVAKEAGLAGDYWMSSVIKDVRHAGLNHFKEYKMACTINHGSTFNEDMVRRYFKLNIIKEEEGSEANVQKCVDILRRRFENREQYHTYHNGVILLEKSY